MFIKKGNIYILVMLLFSFTIILNGCIVNNAIRGNREMIDGELIITDTVKRIDISEVSATVNVTAEKNDKITYTIDANLKDLVDIKFNDGALSISSNKAKTKIGHDNKIIFNIGTDILEALYVSDAKVNGEGTFTADTFTFDILGASEANLNLNTDSIIIRSSGATDITLSGETAELIIESNGASVIKTKELTAQDVSITFNGAGTMQVYADNKLNISGNGVSSIEYWGNAELTKSTKGLSSIKKGN